MSASDVSSASSTPTSCCKSADGVSPASGGMSLLFMKTGCGHDDSVRVTPPQMMVVLVTTALQRLHHISTTSRSSSSCAAGWGGGSDGVCAGKTTAMSLTV